MCIFFFTVFNQNAETTVLSNGYSNPFISNTVSQPDSNVAEINRVAPVVPAPTSSSVTQGKQPTRNAQHSL
jgi:hypothetical protein